MKYSKEREKVDAYFNNQLIVRKGFKPIDITKGIDWNYQHSDNANTYQTYLHSLSIVDALVIISKYDDNEILQKYARDIILDWNKTDHAKGKNHAWKEHPVSSRLNYLIDFQNLSERYKLSNKLFNRMIIEHCEFLFNERNYKFNNHGLMMDYSLLNASSYIVDKEKKTKYIDKALYRVRYALRRDFTRRGVHLENSPEYHRMVLSIFKKIENKLKELRVPIGKEEKSILNLAQEFKNYMIQPNLVYPIIGDTGHINDTKIKKNYKNFYDTESGIGIFNNFNKSNPEKSTMLTFKSGYFSKTHKHYDDLSVTLFMSGQELLSDSGKYSYASKDPIRQHIISPQAHNTIGIPGKKYKLIDSINEQSQLKLTGYRTNKDYIFSSGINRLYEGVNLIRYNILTKDDLYIVADRMVSKNNENVQQNFNINENATISRIDNLTYEISLGQEEFIIKTFERFNTSITSSIEKGYISRKFNNYIENSRITFNQQTDNATFITAIFNKKNIDNIGDIKLHNNQIIFNQNNKEIRVDL